MVCLLYLLFHMKNKSDVSIMFHVFNRMIHTQFGVQIKHIKSDHGKEYFN